MTVPFSFARDNKAFLVAGQTKTRSLICTPETPLHAIAECIRVSEGAYQLENVDPQQFANLLSQHYEESNSNNVSKATEGLEGIEFEEAANALKKEDLMTSNTEAPVENFVNAMLADAVKKGASDVYIEPSETVINIRYRIDGKVHAQDKQDIRHLDKIVRNIKVRAKMDISSTKKPLDGRIKTSYLGEVLDVRVATIGVEFGEKVTMRLLKHDDVRTIDQIGFDETELVIVKRMLSKSSGIVLLVGSTGSGKTTSCYGILGYLNDGSKTIITIEDPVEKHLNGISQTPVNEVAGVTFTTFLKGLVRHRADVVLVAEIRDSETAHLAISSSLADHLILASLHSHSASAALPRLIDMGVEPYQVASTLSGVIAQKLTRQLCPHCKKQRMATKEEKVFLGVNQEQDYLIFEAVGCAKCTEGYKGQVAIFDIIEVDRQVRTLLKEPDAEMAIEDYSRNFHPGMFRSCANKVIAGLTSIDELIKVKNELRD